jgi:hypothetical protein
MQYVINDILGKYKFNDGVNDGGIIIRCGDSKINVHREVLLLCSDYFKNLYSFGKNIKSDNDLLELVYCNKKDNILIDLPGSDALDKIYQNKSMLIIFNLLYDPEYKITNSNKIALFVHVHEIADFLLLNEQSIKVLDKYYSIFIKHGCVNLTESRLSNFLALYSKISHHHGEKLIILVCEENLEMAKVVFNNHLKSVFNDLEYECSLCTSIKKYNLGKLNLKKICEIMRKLIFKN